MAKPMNLLIVAAALFFSGNLAAQTYKCVDAKGKVTYTGSKCSDLKLKDGGEIKDRLQVGPGDRAAAKAATAPPKPPSKPGTRTAEAPPAPTAAPPKAEGAERRCFTVKTAKGTATRCGDKQEE